jgi:3-oxoacyl-[acyl-carrier-protein] synthase III
LDSILEIVGNGAWNGGTPVANAVYENKGMSFKGGIPVTAQTIEDRIGVRTRMAAAPDEKIGLMALQALLAAPGFDPTRIKLLIGATNIGENRYDPGPLIRHPFEIVRKFCPNTMVMDLYAGCPGFNVSVELIFMLSLAGILGPGDISVVVGAENLHREIVFRPMDTSNIIFGDDAMATALQTTSARNQSGEVAEKRMPRCRVAGDFVTGIAQHLVDLTGRRRIDGIIVDNQLGKFLYRVPATAARVQHQMVELMHPEEVAQKTFNRFKDALNFYDAHVNSFAFDIMTLEKDPAMVEKIARSYVLSGRYNAVASVFLAPDFTADIVIHEGRGCRFEKPRHGVIDTRTTTHGVFADYIQAVADGDDVVGEMDGKGVFLHATRGAKVHLTRLLSENNMTLNDIELLFEHQANFAMIPLTLEQVLPVDDGGDVKKSAADYIANKMVNNIHTRGNCSVVCMQRLPYDLRQNVLTPDSVHGFPINRNLDGLKNAKKILYDSVGSGMTRSSFLRIIP